MIKSIKHKALRNYWQTGKAKGLDARWINKLTIILDALEAANEPEAMNIPGFRFHALKGGLAGYYSVWLTGNYRVIFQFDGTEFTLIDITDYH